MNVIEATSGNTAIGLAMVCSVLGYPCNLVMPKNISKERIQICKAYGAGILLVNGNMDNAIAYVERIMRNKEYSYNFYNPNQFYNSNNWKAHYNSTGPEITLQLGKIFHWAEYNYNMNPTHFISAIGTTGTIMGCSMWFKDNYFSQQHFLNDIYRTKIIAVSPSKDSKIQGLKNLQFSRIPKIYNSRLIDKTITVKDEDAFKMTKQLAKKEGLFCGVSSGAAMDIAIKVAKQLDSGIIAVILPDNGYRYLSEKVF